VLRFTDRQGCVLGKAPLTCWYTCSAAGLLMTVVVSSRAARSFIAATASAETWPALLTRNQAI